MSKDVSLSDQQVLDQRAQALAQPRRRLTSRRAWRQVLEFQLFGKPYGVDLDRVHAITRVGAIHPVPLTPPHLHIIRRHGESVTLVSLRHFFDPTVQGVYDADYAMIVAARGKRFALQTEDISGVLRLNPETIRAPTDNLDPAQRPYVEGVSTDGVILLSLDRLVAAEHFAAGGPQERSPDAPVGRPSGKKQT